MAQTLGGAQQQRAPFRLLAPTQNLRQLFPHFPFQQNHSLFKLAEGSATVAGRGVEGDQLVVYLFGQRVNGQGTLGGGNRFGVGTASGIRVYQERQCIQHTGLPAFLFYRK